MTQPGWLDMFHDLHAAWNVEGLWSVLLSWHGIRSSTQWEEPYVLFRRFHAEEPVGAVVTAALLCTDHRWRKASHHLVARLVRSGALSDADVQSLAEWFVAGALAVEVEGMELDGLEIELNDEQVGGDGVESNAGGDVAGLSTVERPIWPSLRRWASAFLVSRDPARWRSLLDAAEALPSRDGDALAAGVMDASSHIPIHDRSDALTMGLAWGSGIVRLAALPAFADLKGTEAALARAAGDPSAKVRAWTPKAISSPGQAKPVPHAEDPNSAAGATGQASLF